MVLDYPILLTNKQMDYDWGMVNGLERFFNIAPERKGMKQAELWVGSHTKAPSYGTLKDGQCVSLEVLLKEHATALLGSQPHFPFLFKLMSIAKPLSIQVHPNEEQAKKGFTKETQEGVALDHAQRNYRDQNGKPELFYAHSASRLMCGFKKRDAIQVALTHFMKYSEVEVEQWRAILMRPDGIRRSFLHMLKSFNSLNIKDVLKICDQHKGCPTWEAVRLLCAIYPEDPAVLAPLWLKVISLAAGEAIFIAPGCPHSYLYGVGIEIMQCSDNVLRGGLTTKHVDLEAFSEILTIEQQEVCSMVSPLTYGEEGYAFESYSRDFMLGFLKIKGGWHKRAGMVQIVHVLEGSIQLRSVQHTQTLTRGQTGLLPAVSEIAVSGQARVVIGAGASALSAMTLWMQEDVG